MMIYNLGRGGDGVVYYEAIIVAIDFERAHVVLWRQIGLDTVEYRSAN